LGTVHQLINEKVIKIKVMWYDKEVQARDITAEMTIPFNQ